MLATRLKNLKPNEFTYLCEEHFNLTDYNNPLDPKSRLKRGAIPSLFAFPPHLQVVPKKRKSPTERSFLNDDENENELSEGEQSDSSEISDDKTEKLEEKLQKSRAKIRKLQQQLRRKTQKIENMSDVLRDLKERSLLSADASNVIDECFSGLSLQIIRNHFTNQDRAPNGYRHNEEVKKFVVSLHYSSPAAYEYVRSVLALPSARSIANWTSSVDCQPGFFLDVFTF